MNEADSHDFRLAFKALLLIRPLSAITGIGAVLLLSQGLPASVYADFFLLWAVYEIAILASNFGTFHATYRYVYLIKQPGKNIIGGIARKLVPLRAALLLIGAAVVAAVIAKSGLPLKSIAGSDLASTAILASLVMLCEGSARFLENLGDTLLVQRDVQISTFIRSIGRAIGYAFVVTSANPTLLGVIWADLIAALLGLAFIGYRIFSAHIMPRPGPSADGQTAIQILKFVIPSFLAQLIGLGYSPDAIKLILGEKSSDLSVATFGLGFSLVSMAFRYLPSTILSGIFRPAFVLADRSGIAGCQPERSVRALLGTVMKVNTLYCGALVCTCASAFIVLSATTALNRYPDLPTVTVVLAILSFPIAVHATMGLLYLCKEVSIPSLFGTLTGLTITAISLNELVDKGANGAAWSAVLGELGWIAGAVVFSIPLLRGIQFFSVLKINSLFLPFAASGYFAVTELSGQPVLAIFVTTTPILAFLWLARRRSIFSSDEQLVLGALLPAKLLTLLSLAKQIKPTLPT
jgi:hypothetical protein